MTRPMHELVGLKSLDWKDGGAGIHYADFPFGTYAYFAKDRESDTIKLYYGMDVDAIVSGVREDVGLFDNAMRARIGAMRDLGKRASEMLVVRD